MSFKLHFSVVIKCHADNCEQKLHDLNIGHGENIRHAHPIMLDKMSNYKVTFMPNTYHVNYVLLTFN